MNKELSKKRLKLNGKAVIYLICLTDWINDSSHLVADTFSSETIKNFEFSKKDSFQKSRVYFKSMRTLIAAHPLKIDKKNEEVNYVEDFICIDVLSSLPKRMTFLKSSHPEFFKYIDLDGMHDGYKKSNFYLQAYSTKTNGNKYSLYIGVNLEDILQFARLSIDKIYELDEHFSKLKKKVFFSLSERN